LIRCRPTAENEITLRIRPDDFPASDLDRGGKDAAPLGGARWPSNTRPRFTHARLSELLGADDANESKFTAIKGDDIRGPLDSYEVALAFG
jgi:hypothetical protein